MKFMTVVVFIAIGKYWTFLKHTRNAFLTSGVLTQYLGLSIQVPVLL